VGALAILALFRLLFKYKKELAKAEPDLASKTSVAA
jgi:hypothetical protein